MVGLPARGKSLIAGKGELDSYSDVDYLTTAVKRYLKWTSVKAEIFNVGKYRRSDNPHPDAKFFDINNPEGEKARRAAAEAAVEDLLRWLENQDNKVAILDATNSTKSRRAWIHDRLKADGRLLLRTTTNALLDRHWADKMRRPLR